MLSFAAPAFLWGLAALPLVVLLHRIRVRRQRREVAGAFLWRRARDEAVHAPRFRPSLLLLLQLLAVTLLTLAAARPAWDAAGPPLSVLVIDGAATMTARDGATSPVGREVEGLAADATRLDAARARARELIEAGGPVAIVRGGRAPRLAFPPGDDRAAARAALDALTAGDADRDARRALTLGRDVASGRPGAVIHWLSDVPPPATAGVRVHPVAGEGRNVGLTGFELVAGQAWLQVASTHPRPVEAAVEIVRGDDRLAATTLLVPAGGTASTSFPVAADPRPLVARVLPPAGDALALDDEAWASAASTVVALDRGFAALERALGAMDGVEVRVTSAAANVPADLHVLHGRLDRPAPAGATLLLPDRDAPAVGATVARWDATDPLLRFVDLSDLRVAYLDPPAFGEAAGWTTLAYGAVDVAGGADDAATPDATAAGPGASVPLLQRLDRPEGPVWRAAFHPVRGELTLRPAFPALVVNLVDRIRTEDRLRLGAALPAGATRAGEPASAALTPGPYRVDGRTRLASLLDEEATRLPDAAGFAAAMAGGGAGGAATDGPSVAPGSAGGDGGTSRWDVTRWAIGVALALLALEWVGYAGLRAPSWWRGRAPGRGPA